MKENLNNTVTDSDEVSARLAEIVKFCEELVSLQAKIEDRRQGFYRDWDSGVLVEQLKGVFLKEFSLKEQNFTCVKTLDCFPYYSTKDFIQIASCVLVFLKDNDLFFIVPSTKKDSSYDIMIDVYCVKDGCTFWYGKRIGMLWIQEMVIFVKSLSESNDTYLSTLKTGNANMPQWRELFPLL